MSDPSSESGPVAESERLVSLDFLRGLAIFGIFVVNVQFMALPSWLATEPSYPGGPGDVWAFGITRALFEGSFVAIFSLLFGAGLVLQVRRAEDRGIGSGAAPLRRLVLLGLVGLAHGVLLFMGDILFLYSLTGLILYACRRLEPRTMLAVGLLLVAFSMVGGAGVATLDHVFSGLQGDVEADTLEELRIHNEGPLSELLALRASEYALWMFASSLWFNWRVLGMFFLGAALMQRGFFRADRAALQRRFAVLGLAIGAPLEVLGAVVAAAEPGLLARAGFGALHEASSLVLALGIAGLACRVVHVAALAPVVRAGSAVGRLALTNYIAQSVVGNLLFSFLGCAWFGQRTRWELLGIVVATYLAQCAFSIVWLRTFRVGPLEWLWRSATYLRLQPLRR